ncbi:MAG: AAA family ATPase, partial [Cyclobacteriaceae bacterium]
VSQEPFLDYPTTISKIGFKGVRLTHKPEYLISSLLIDAILSATQQIFDKSEFTTFDSFRFSESVTSEFLELTFSIFNESEGFSIIKSNLSWLTDIGDIRLNNIAYCRFDREAIFLENIQFEFLLNGNWIPWGGLSDGTKRLFLIVSEIFMSSNDVFLLEEPELGIHPHQLSKLMAFIKERSKHQQIILTTHSPQVLDVLDKDELDSIILCEMTEEGSKLRHLADKEKKKAIHYMENEAFLSDYWRFSDLEKV